MAKTSTQQHTVTYVYDADTKGTHRFRATEENLPVGSNVLYVRKDKYAKAPKKVVGVFTVET